MTAASPTTSAATLAGRQTRHWTLAKAQLKATEFLDELDTKGINAEVQKAAQVKSEGPLQSKILRVFRRNPQRVHFVKRILASKWFRSLIMVIIISNVITIAIETEMQTKDPILGNANVPQFFSIIDLVYLALYTVEFVLKVYVAPIRYWQSSYNQFDFVILVISYFQWVFGMMSTQTLNLTFLRVLRALRGLRAFRSVSFIRSLQIIINALITTIKRNVVDLIMLLLLFMFIFGITGHYLFGESNDTPKSKELWGTLGSSFHALFVYVTMDNWTFYQDTLRKDGYVGSEIFSALFIFIGNFIFTNLFVGVICDNIQEATDEDKRQQQAKRRQAKILKRDLFLRKQRSDIRQLVAQQRLDRNKNMQEVLQKLAGTLRHDDIVPMNHLSCNLMWLETYLVSLHHHENTMYRCQQVQFQLSQVLSEVMDRQLRESGIALNAGANTSSPPKS